MMTPRHEVLEMQSTFVSHALVDINIAAVHGSVQ